MTATPPTFGTGTVLNPPVTIDGTAYGLALQFAPHLSNRSPLTDEIVSGTASTVTLAAANTYDVVCARDYQTSSYTGGDPGARREIEFECLMGGNIAATHERQRIICHANDQSFRGGNRGSRAEIGDTYVITESGVERRGLIIGVYPFDTAPASVAWQGTDPVALTWYVEHACNNVYLTNEDGATGRINFVFDVATFSDCAVEWENTITPTSGTCAARVFDSTADYYPPDASFHATNPEYHVDSVSGNFHFGTGGLTLVSADTIHITHYRSTTTHGETQTPASASIPHHIQADAAGDGYATTADELVALHQETFEDFTGPSVIIDSGAGAVEYRETADKDSIVIALAWSSSGVLGSIYKRTTTGGSIATSASSGATMTFPFYVRVTKSGSTITVQRSADGAAWTSESTLTSSVDPGLAGVSSWDGNKLKFHNLTAAQIVDLLTPGTWYMRRRDSFADQAWFATYDFPVATGTQALTSISDRTTETTMGAVGATIQRDKYAISGGAGNPLVLYSETSGDRVRVIQAAPVSAPSTPGRPPRTFNQTNFATMSGVDGVATTTLSENQGQYHDRIRVRMENGDDIPTGAFTVRRDPFADPRSAPTLQIDARNGAGDWATVDSSNYLAYWTEGLILVKQSYLDGLGLDATARVCFRVAGSLFRQCGTPADHYNRLAKVLNQTDEPWLDIAVSGNAAAVSGTAELLGIVAATFECDGAYAYMATAMIGTERENWFVVSQLLIDEGATYPYWHANDDGSIRYSGYAGADPSGFISATYNVSHNCGSSSWNEKDVGSTAQSVIIFPFQDDGTGDNHIGTSVDADAFANLILNTPSFSFTGQPFDPTATEYLRRCPTGTTCLQAWARVKFSGLQICTWTFSTSYTGAVGGAVTDSDSQYTWNGTTVARYTVVGGVVTVNYDNSGTTDKYIDNGNVAFQLMGKRVDSTRIWCPITSNPLGGYGIWKEEAAGTWTSFSAGIATGGAAVDGEWVLIDVTNVINAVLATGLRDSLFTEFQLWPSIAGVNPGTSVDNMIGLAASTSPTQSVTYTITHPAGVRTATQTYSASGQDIVWSNLEWDSIHAQLRFPSGAITQRTLPVYQPPLIPPY